MRAAAWMWPGCASMKRRSVTARVASGNRPRSMPRRRSERRFIASLEQSLAENPENSSASMVLGYLKFLRRDYEGAKLCLQATAALEPDNEEARRLLDFIYQIESRVS